MRTSKISFLHYFGIKTHAICIQFHVFSNRSSLLDVFEVMGQFSDLVSSFEEKISFWCSVSVRRIMDLYAHHRLSEIQTHEFVGILEVGSCYILF